jgi:hypothetical protein
MPLRAGAVWTCGLIALCAQAPPRETLLLSRIRQHMQQRLSDVPNYTCQETIERSVRPPRKRKFRQIDKVLLEVAQVGGRELLAWPGGRFEAKPLSAFATSGLMSNGAFAMHARSIFFGGRATFTYVGARRAGGPKLVRYDFKVPQALSGYRVKSGPKAAVVGYHGSLFADPETLDVARLEVYTDSIPQEIPMAKADMTIEYQPVRIGSTQALLPKAAELSVLRRGTRNLERNRITFSGCRQYGSESVISYASPQALPPAAADKPEDRDVVDLQLPAGLLLPVRLETALDSTQTAVGTPVLALVDEDVTDGGRLLIPKGARLSGRVRSLARVGPPMRAFEIGLEFSQAEWPGARAHFTAGLEEVEAASGAQLTLSAFVEDSVEPSAIGIFYMKGTEFKLGAGLKMVWRVLP